jgi:hypothetical protein
MPPNADSRTRYLAAADAALVAGDPVTARIILDAVAYADRYGPSPNDSSETS